VAPFHSNAAEILVFDWNKPIPKYQGWFIEGPTQWVPNNQPVRNNFDWTKPINYANGTYYVRVLVKKMRANDDFQIYVNHWQNVPYIWKDKHNMIGKPAETNMHPNELRFSYRGTPITRTFTYAVNKLISNQSWDPQHWGPFLWNKPRDLVGFFFPAFASAPPSSKIAANVFPVDIRVTIVNVAPGSTFSGWTKYP